MNTPNQTPSFSHHDAIHAAYCELSSAVCRFLCEYHRDSLVASHRLDDWKGPHDGWPVGLKDILRDAAYLDAMAAERA